MTTLLSIIVERWKTGFKGISALEIRDILGISHEHAIAYICNGVKGDKGDKGDAGDGFKWMGAWSASVHYVNWGPDRGRRHP